MILVYTSTVFPSADSEWIVRPLGSCAVGIAGTALLPENKKKTQWADGCHGMS